jgi:K+-transporting ATPase ATPase C chain
MRDTLTTLFIALRLTLLTLVLTGLLYPLGMTGLAQLLFPSQARGSLVTDDKGHVLGSALIGQRFTAAPYFQSRPSAAGDAGYDSTASSGSNLGPTARKLRERVQLELARLLKENPEAQGPVPTDLVTASASGLDPHLSPAAAMWQVPRIARARGITAQRVAAVVQDQIEGRELGFLGEPQVNVLLLNLALDQHFGRPGPQG